MIFVPESWKKPELVEMTDYFRNRPKAKEGRPVGSVIVFRKYISPLDVYKYLAARFGPPYGFQTLFKKPNDSDNLIHWDYLVKAGTNMIWFQGGNREVQVQIDGKIMSPEDWVQFSKALKCEFGRCASGMVKVGATLEKWSIVSNRFAMIAGACAEFHDILTDEADAPDFTPHKRHTEEGIQRYYAQIEEVRQRGNRVFSASLSLDLITPVLAEAFINLVIFVTRKDELKQNQRQYDQYIRQAIDTRVYDLHLKCNHFTSKIDPNGKEYKAFKKVMDRRNHALHGNIDPVKDAIETVFFDNFTPLYEKGADPILELFRKKEAVFDISGVLNRYHDIHSFFHYILSLIESNVRDKIEMFMSDETFGYDASRNKLGRLFPSHEVMMLIPVDYDDELNFVWQ
jgi:hypothetical protein